MRICSSLTCLGLVAIFVALANAAVDREARALQALLTELVARLKKANDLKRQLADNPEEAAEIFSELTNLDVKEQEEIIKSITWLDEKDQKEKQLREKAKELRRHGEPKEAKKKLPTCW